MTDWTKVVTQPLGLAGFALFLVFGYLAKATKSDARRWLSPAAVGLALIALLGGLMIAYKQVRQVAPLPTLPVQTSQSGQLQVNNNIQQISVAPGSPNVQGVQGDLTITIDQSAGMAGSKKVTANDDSLQQNINDCSKRASSKDLKGDDRKQFMYDCLSKMPTATSAPSRTP